MGITKKDIAYVAHLSRLKISPEEIKRFTKQLSDIIKYMDKLKKVDTKKTSPTSHPMPLKNVFRKDEVRASLDTKEAIGITHHKKGTFFKVPRVIKED